MHPSSWTESRTTCDPFLSQVQQRCNPLAVTKELSGAEKRLASSRRSEVAVAQGAKTQDTKCIVIPLNWGYHASQAKRRYDRPNEESKCEETHRNAQQCGPVSQSSGNDGQRLKWYA